MNRLAYVRSMSTPTQFYVFDRMGGGKVALVGRSFIPEQKAHGSWFVKMFGFGDFIFFPSERAARAYVRVQTGL